MTILINFSKYEGAGNDFIAIDMTSSKITLTSDQVRRMCHRKMGIGADGVLVLERSGKPQCVYKLLYFNADGNEGSLCGNGSRCSLAFAERIGLTDFGGTETGLGGPETVLENGVTPQPSATAKTICFEACDGLHMGGKFSRPDTHRQTKEDSEKDIYFVDIKDVTASAVRNLGENDFFLDTGSPHHVRILTGDQDLDSLDVYGVGVELRWKVYGAEGANINFVKVKTEESALQQNQIEEETTARAEDTRSTNRLKKDVLESRSPRIAIRTFERGVEDETLACGTGATASAIAEYLRRVCQMNVMTQPEDPMTKPPLVMTKATVEARGGVLEVTFSFDGKTFFDIKLCGGATHVFDGTIIV